MKIAIKKGHTYRTRNGGKETIAECDQKYCYTATNSKYELETGKCVWYMGTGVYAMTIPFDFSQYDLFEEVTE